MTRSNLQTDVEILLEKSNLVGHDDVLHDSGAVQNLSGPTAIIADDPEAYHLNHQQAESIKKLFFQSNKEKQKEILEVLTEDLKKGGHITRTACIALIETGNLSLLIRLLRENFVSDDQHGYHMALNVLNSYIQYFWPALSLSQVKELREWTRQCRDAENELGRQMVVRRVAYSQIASFLTSIHNQTTHILARDIDDRINTGYNPEVNEDKEEIKREVSRFGFPPDLTETLDKIDQKFSQAHDAFDFKGCMDLIRAFTERLYRSVLDTYGDKGKKVDDKDSEAVARFFESEGLVSDHFANMIAQQRHFLSDQGSHRIKSREEDARLSKNMVIEMSLYLLRRFENH